MVGLRPPPASFIFHARLLSLRILIFTAVVGADELLKITDKRKVLAFILLFSMACARVPGRIGTLLLPRLVATLALYVLLLQTLASDKDIRIGKEMGGSCCFGHCGACDFKFETLEEPD